MKETFYVGIEKNIKDSFEEETKKRGHKKTEVIEALMTYYIENKLSIEVEMKKSYQIILKDEKGK